MPSHVFSDLEGLKIACEMEKRGEAFYRRAAKVTSNPRSAEMLLALAEDEKAHGAEFLRLCQKEGGCPCEEAYDDETNAYLSAVAADVVFPGGLMAVRRQGFESPRGVILYAIESEKDSVLFYMELAQKGKDAHAREIFLEIARQEKRHMRRLQAQLALLDGQAETEMNP